MRNIGMIKFMMANTDETNKSNANKQETIRKK